MVWLDDRIINTTPVAYLILSVIRSVFGSLMENCATLSFISSNILQLYRRSFVSVTFGASSRPSFRRRSQFVARIARFNACQQSSSSTRLEWVSSPSSPTSGLSGRRSRLENGAGDDHVHCVQRH